MTRTHRSRAASLAVLVAALVATSAPARAQSTATVQGTVTDTQNAIMPGVSITIRNAATGAERTAITDAAGQYVAASLAPGPYTLVAHIDGFKDQTTEVVLEVAQIAVVSMKLGVATLSENVTVTGASPLIETATISLGLMPGGVTAPQNAGLSAPLRGQGSFSFMSAGNRETSVNFMVNASK
jgi:hypothetical protein